MKSCQYCEKMQEIMNKYINEYNHNLRIEIHEQKEQEKKEKAINQQQLVNNKQVPNKEDIQMENFI